MKYSKIIAIILLVLFISGCQKNQDASVNTKTMMDDLGIMNETLRSEIAKLEEENNILNQKNEVLQETLNKMESKDEAMIVEDTFTEFEAESVASYSNGTIKFITTRESVGTCFTMTLIGYNSNLHDETLEVLDYSNGETPTAKFKVFGTLYNFKIVKVDWNSDFSDYTIKKEICSLDEVTNKSIVFDSVLAKGYPNELLIWENREGDLKYFRLSHDGFGFTNQVLLCDVYKSNNHEDKSRTDLSIETYLNMKMSEVIEVTKVGFSDDYASLSLTESHMYFPFLFDKELGVTFVFGNTYDDLKPICLVVEQESNIHNFDVKGAKPGVDFKEIQDILGDVECKETWMSNEKNTAYEISYHEDNVVYRFVSYDELGKDSALYISLEYTQ